MNLSYKNRIAFYYMVATAMIMTLVFFAIFLVVETAVYSKLDNDLGYEAHKHTKEIQVVKDSILFINKTEWEEREHREAQVNPVFVQIVNEKGELMDKSPNLKEGALTFHLDKKLDTHFDTELNQEAIRQVQIPIHEHGILKGFILTAMSQEGARLVLNQLKNTLSLLFPIVLLGLFIITRFLAGRSIQPIQIMTSTADQITRNSLNERIPLPQNKDELYTLAFSINQLLDRIQEAMAREKQFTSDASHQLRTPLAVLKGTLEVLIRKSRNEEEYKAKIGLSIREIDRISEIVNQLLILARLDTQNYQLTKKNVDLRITIDDILQRFNTPLQAKKLSVKVDTNHTSQLSSDPYYVELVLENIISNAVKYACADGSIIISTYQEEETLVCKIQDDGIGIEALDLDNIFHPFFRSDALNHKDIKGNGLGLSIVKKACDLLNATIEVESQVGKGTNFTVYFPR